MASACELIDAELAVDRLEAELAVELPAHVRAFARAHAQGRPVPPAPPIARRAASLETARRACRHPELADRALPLLRLIAPIAIEDDPAVSAARGALPTWAHYEALSRARDNAARARFGRGAIELMHWLHGVAQVGADSAAAIDDAPHAWRDRDRELGIDAIEAAWQAIAKATGLHGVVRIEQARARSRAFVVEPGVEVIVVVPAQVDSPAARFAVLHELGHAVCALSSRTPVPRVVDEAVASRIARLMEGGGIIDDRWASPLASEARRRRTALAARLDHRERHPIDDATGTPPWSLWHDPGAQAAYVAAEDLANRLPIEAIVPAIARERSRIDLATTSL